MSIVDIYNKLIKYLSISKRFFPLTLVLIIIAFILFKFIESYNHKRVFSSDNIQVIDGDSIQLGDSEVRLKGMYAPERWSNILKTEFRKYVLRIQARAKLIELIGAHTVECTDEDKDIHKRQLSYCYANGINLNKEMVKQGYAYA